VKRFDRDVSCPLDRLELPDEAPYMAAAVLLARFNIGELGLQTGHHHSRTQVALTITGE